VNQVCEVEEILFSPDRVHCIPYAANLSREACLKQQEMARSQRRGWGWRPPDALASREPCLRCGEAVGAQGNTPVPSNSGKPLGKATGSAESAQTSPDKPSGAASAGSRLPRPRHCRFHPDRPRHRDFLVCLPCYRVLQKRLNQARREMVMATPRVKKIYRETIKDLERQMGCLTHNSKENHGDH
jgi:hypothetical protein